MSTPYHFTPRVPAPPHPTPASVSAYILTNPKKLRPPVRNPYDKFTQPEFDAWIGDITGALRRALGQDEEVPTETRKQDTSEGKPQRYPYYTPVEAGDSDDEAIDDSFANFKARRAGKGKARDPREGPGLGKGDSAQPIQIISSDEEEEEEVELSMAQLGDDSEDEEEEEQEYSSEEEYAWEQGQSSTQLIPYPERSMRRQEEEEEEGEEGEEYEVEDEEDEDDGEEEQNTKEEENKGAKSDEYDSDDYSGEADYGDAYDDDDYAEDEEGHARASSPPVIELISDDEVEIQPPPVAPRIADEARYDYHEEAQDEDEEEQEREQERDEEEQNEGRVQNPNPNHSGDVGRYFGEEQEAREDVSPETTHHLLHVTQVAETSQTIDQTVILDVDDDEIQLIEPDAVEAFEASLPPKWRRALDIRQSRVEIPDPWDGPRTYAEDFYSGGDVRSDFGGQMMDPSRLGPEDVAPIRDSSAEVQPQPLNEDTSFPPQTLSLPIEQQRDVEIPDPWSNARHYAQDFYSGGPFAFPLTSPLDPNHLNSRDTENIDIDVDEALEEALEEEFEDEIQPLNADASFPSHERAEEAPPVIADPWEGTQVYAEDFYSGGDVRTMPGVPIDPSLLSGTGDPDDGIDAFLTPGALSPTQSERIAILAEDNLGQDALAEPEPEVPKPRQPIPMDAEFISIDDSEDEEEKMHDTLSQPIPVVDDYSSLYTFEEVIESDLQETGTNVPESQNEPVGDLFEELDLEKLQEYITGQQAPIDDDSDSDDANDVPDEVLSKFLSDLPPLESEKSQVIPDVEADIVTLPAEIIPVQDDETDDVRQKEDALAEIVEPDATEPSPIHDEAEKDALIPDTEAIKEMEEEKLEDSSNLLSEGHDDVSPKADTPVTRQSETVDIQDEGQEQPTSSPDTVESNLQKVSETAAVAPIDVSPLAIFLAPPARAGKHSTPSPRAEGAQVVSSTGTSFLTSEQHKLINEINSTIHRAFFNPMSAGDSAAPLPSADVNKETKTGPTISNIISSAEPALGLPFKLPTTQPASAFPDPASNAMFIPFVGQPLDSQTTSLPSAFDPSTLPMGVSMSTRNRMPILVSDPYPYSLSTPYSPYHYMLTGEASASEEDTGLDNSMSSNSTLEQEKDKKEIVAVVDDADNLELQYPPEHEVIEEFKNAGIPLPILQTSEELLASLPTMSSISTDVDTSTFVASAPTDEVEQPTNLSNTEPVLSPTGSKDTIGDSNLSSVEPKPQTPLVKSSSKRSQKRKRDTSPTPRSSSHIEPPVGQKVKGKRFSKSERKIKSQDLKDELASEETIRVRPRPKDAHKADQLENAEENAPPPFRLLQGSDRASSIASSSTSDISAAIQQPSPSVNKPQRPPLVPQTSLFHAHGKGKKQLQPLPPTFRPRSVKLILPEPPKASTSRISEESAPSASTAKPLSSDNTTSTPPALPTSQDLVVDVVPDTNTVDNSTAPNTPTALSPASTALSVKPATPKLAVPTSATGTPAQHVSHRARSNRYASLTGSPVTRSHCKYHRISLPREEYGPRICFLVPGCSLNDKELMEEEEIEDHGDATMEDACRIVKDLDLLGFHSDLIGILRQLVGLDILREQEVFYRLGPGEEMPTRSTNTLKKTPSDKVAMAKLSVEPSSNAGSPEYFGAFAASPGSRRTATPLASSSPAFSGRRSGIDSEKESTFAATDTELDVSDAEEPEAKRVKSSPSEDPVSMGPPPLIQSKLKGKTKRAKVKLAKSKLEGEAVEGAEADKASRKPRKSTSTKRGVKRSRPSESVVAGEGEGNEPNFKKIKADSYTSTASSPEKPPSEAA